MVKGFKTLVNDWTYKNLRSITDLCPNWSDVRIASLNLSIYVLSFCGLSVVTHPKLILFWSHLTRNAHLILTFDYTKLSFLSCLSKKTGT